MVKIRMNSIEQYLRPLLTGSLASFCSRETAYPSLRFSFSDADLSNDHHEQSKLRTMLCQCGRLESCSAWLEVHAVITPLQGNHVLLLAATSMLENITELSHCRVSCSRLGPQVVYPGRADAPELPDSELFASRSTICATSATGWRPDHSVPC